MQTPGIVIARLNSPPPMRTEILGGTTTFLAMAYIIVVNPAILRAAGLPTGASTVATILVAVIGSLLMGVWAKRPIAVAPYMGENAFIAFGLAALGVAWVRGGAPGRGGGARVVHHPVSPPPPPPCGVARPARPRAVFPAAPVSPAPTPAVPGAARTRLRPTRCCHV